MCGIPVPFICLLEGIRSRSPTPVNTPLEQLGIWQPGEVWNFSLHDKWPLRLYQVTRCRLFLRTCSVRWKVVRPAKWFHKLISFRSVSMIRDVIFLPSTPAFHTPPPLPLSSREKQMQQNWLLYRVKLHCRTPLCRTIICFSSSILDFQ